jgi:signal transduction histidine kinase
MKFWGAFFIKIVFFKYLLILFCLVAPLYNAISQVNVDSLKNIIPRLSGTEKFEAIQLLTYELPYTDLEGYYDYTKLGLELALSQNDSLFISSFLIDMGYYYHYINDFRKTLNELRRAELIAFQNGYKRNLAIVYTALGTVYLDNNLYDSALYYHTKSLSVKEELGNKADIATSYNNIGLVYYKIAYPENAIEYYKKALEIKLSLNDTASCIKPYVNLGLVYSEIEDAAMWTNAISSFNTAIELAQKYNSAYFLCSSYTGLATVYEKRQMYDSAKHYLDLSNRISLENKYINQESSNYFLLAKIAVQENKLELAIRYLDMSMKLLHKSPDLNRKKNIFKLYADIFEERRNMDSAFYFQKEYINVKDSIFHDELATNISKMQIATIEEQNQKVIADQEEKITQTKFFLLFLLAILALSIALIIVIFRSYSQTNKINRQLQESQKKIEAQRANLEKKNTQLADAQITIKNQNESLRNINVDLDKKVKERTSELNKSNLGLEKAVRDLDQFIYKTSHDLRGPIATMQGIINLGIVDAIDDRSKEYFNTLHAVSTNLNNVLYRLIEVHETYQKEPILEFLDPIKEIIDTTDRVSKFNIDSDLKIVTNLEASGKWNSDRVLFNLFIENMLRNAFLYRDGGESIIKIKSEYQGDNMHITIEDNGFGIQQGDEEKVFNIFFKGSPRPGGTGLEVYTSKIAVEKLGGSISLVRPMKNTIFKIILPIIKK